MTFARDCVIVFFALVLIITVWIILSDPMDHECDYEYPIPEYPEWFDDKYKKL